MSDLVCLAYEDKETADKVLNTLRGLQTEYQIDLEDACVVVRDEKGKVQVKQAVNLVGMSAAGGAASGGLFGLLIGLLFLNPLIGWVSGLVIGGGMGALSGALSDYGIDDNFIKSIGDKLTEGTSALFVLVRSVNADKVLPEISQYGGTVLRTSLSKEQDERLQAALKSASEAA